MSDPVDHPTHYNSGGIECIEFIADQGFGEGFCLGNALKYIARAKHKGTYPQDLKKARWYLDWWIANGHRFDLRKADDDEAHYGPSILEPAMRAWSRARGLNDGAVSLEDMTAFYEEVEVLARNWAAVVAGKAGK